jgi:hypothetical protein
MSVLPTKAFTQQWDLVSFRLTDAIQFHMREADDKVLRYFHVGMRVQTGDSSQIKH